MKNKISAFWKRIPPHGQSLVELAIFFPIIMMMLSGMIEFGFLLNYYLNLMDGPREGARFAADRTPFLDGTINPDPTFYNQPDPLQTPGIVQIVENAIRPYSLKSTEDDIVVTILAMDDDGSLFGRFPDNAMRCAVTPLQSSYCYFGNYTSKFTNTEFTDMITSSAGANKMGAVVVELFYSYHQELALPWITVVVPDPIPLHVYAVSPLPVAAPPDCPDATNPMCP